MNVTNTNSRTVPNQRFLLEVGSNIRKWRNLKSIKQESLALQLGITKAALSKIDTGKTDIPLSRFFQIAYVLQLRIHLLFEDPSTLIQNL